MEQKISYFAATKDNSGASQRHEGHHLKHLSNVKRTKTKLGQTMETAFIKENCKGNRNTGFKNNVAKEILYY